MPKKTKAIKTTDEGKAWNKQKNNSQYKIDTIALNKKILITCEGQTEKLYFESFPVLTLNVKAIDLKGQSKTKLVELTEEMYKKQHSDSDEVWCVFDMDVKRGENEFADFDNAIKKAKHLGFKVAYSNDAFELWFYLHFNYIDSQQLRGFYYQELSKFFEINYIKDGKKYDFCLKIYDILLNSTNASQIEAIKRAEKLHLQFKDERIVYHERNPVTTVYKLVEFLNTNLRK